MSKAKDRLAPVHPGDVLREDFMKPLGLSAYAVAKAVGASPIAISQICRSNRSVSAEMALKLRRLFNVSPELWMGIQADYDLEVARLDCQERIQRGGSAAGRFAGSLSSRTVKESGEGKVFNFKCTESSRPPREQSLRLDYRFRGTYLL